MGCRCAQTAKEPKAKVVVVVANTHTHTQGQQTEREPWIRPTVVLRFQAAAAAAFDAVGARRFIVELYKFIPTHIFFFSLLLSHRQRFHHNAKRASNE